MPEQAKEVVTNTTPLISLNAATGNLEVLRVLYEWVSSSVLIKQLWATRKHVPNDKSDLLEGIEEKYS